MQLAFGDLHEFFVICTMMRRESGIGLPERLKLCTHVFHLRPADGSGLHDFLMPALDRFPILRKLVIPAKCVRHVWQTDMAPIPGQRLFRLAAQFMLAETWRS